MRGPRLDQPNATKSPGSGDCTGSTDVSARQRYRSRQMKSVYVGHRREEARAVVRCSGPARVAPYSARFVRAFVDGDFRLVVAERFLQADSLSDAGCSAERCASQESEQWSVCRLLVLSMRDRKTHRCLLRLSLRVSSAVVPWLRFGSVRSQSGGLDEPRTAAALAHSREHASVIRREARERNASASRQGEAVPKSGTQVWCHADRGARKPTWRTEIVLRMLALRLSFCLPLHYSHRDLKTVLVLAEKGRGKRIADSQDCEGARDRKSVV